MVLYRGERAWKLVEDQYGKRVTLALMRGDTLFFTASNGFTYSVRIDFERPGAHTGPSILHSEWSEIDVNNVTTEENYCIHMSDELGVENLQFEHSHHIADRVYTILETIRVAPERMEEIANKMPSCGVTGRPPTFQESFRWGQELSEEAVFPLLSIFEFHVD